MLEAAAASGLPAGGALTYADYLKIDDGNRYELIEGELVLTPAPGFLHQHVAANIEAFLRDHVEKQKLGLVLFAPFDIVPAENVALQPDVLYLSRERFHLLTGDCLKGAPDLAVEVLSPSSGRRDRLQKSRLYLRYGVREYWVADPAAQTVEVFSAGEKGWLLAGAYGPGEALVSPLLPGLEAPVDGIFRLPEGLEL
ncbi:MAG: Uma2 family endonuclease [Peptococcaceae bacterium]|nr:MAG: Uma2 family endonuclease [Peptococcaceae bacterium]